MIRVIRLGAVLNDLFYLVECQDCLEQFNVNISEDQISCPKCKIPGSIQLYFRKVKQEHDSRRSNDREIKTHTNSS